MLELNFLIENETELVNSFRVRDQKKLMLPKALPYPFNVRSYFTWQDPNGVYTYLVFKMPNWDTPRGVTLKRSTTHGEPTGGICNWCHAYGSSEEIGMLSLTVNSNTSLGYHVCQDLRCIEKIEEVSARAGKSPDKSIDQLYYRIEKLFDNLKQAKID